MKLPRHLAIIMDGNGRWAEQRSLPRIAGHQQGVGVVQNIVRECSRLEIPYLTLYAFSFENWKRPPKEVQALMELLVLYLRRELETMLREDIRLNVVGDPSRLPTEVQAMLEETRSTTAGNRRMVLNLALSYGARDELLRAVRRIGIDIRDARLDPRHLDEDLFSGYLDTAGQPDPDLLIRTSGEMRISNFLLWQLAYAELYFTETLWPDFSVEDLHRALQEFGRRERRFGLTAAQSQKEGSSDREERH